MKDPWADRLQADVQELVRLAVGCGCPTCLASVTYTPDPGGFSESMTIHTDKCCAATQQRRADALRATNVVDLVNDPAEEDTGQRS